MVIYMGYPLVGGFSPYPSEKSWSEFVSWDDEIPNMMGNIKNVPNHQPVFFIPAKRLKPWKPLLDLYLRKKHMLNS